MKNPEIEGTYLCRLKNGFICIAYFNGDKWIEMWGRKELEVCRYMPIPAEMYPVPDKEDNPVQDKKLPTFTEACQVLNSDDGEHCCRFLGAKDENGNASPEKVMYQFMVNSIKQLYPEWDERDILLNQLRQYLNTIRFITDRVPWDDKALKLVNDYFDQGGLHIKSNFFGTDRPRMEPKKVSERVDKAVSRDPLYDLALELFQEGYDERRLIKELDAASFPMDGTVRIKLQNHLRDICIRNSAK